MKKNELYWNEIKARYLLSQSITEIIELYKKDLITHCPLKLTHICRSSIKKLAVKSNQFAMIEKWVNRADFWLNKHLVEKLGIRTFQRKKVAGRFYSWWLLCAHHKMQSCDNENDVIWCFNQEMSRVFTWCKASEVNCMLKALQTAGVQRLFALLEADKSCHIQVVNQKKRAYRELFPRLIRQHRLAIGLNNK